MTKEKCAKFHFFVCKIRNFTNHNSPLSRNFRLRNTDQLISHDKRILLLDLTLITFPHFEPSSFSSDIFTEDIYMWHV